MSDLVAFLAARLDDLQSEALALHDVWGCAGTTISDATNDPRTDLCDCGWPEWLAADVAAKRAILELHSGAHECSGYDAVIGEFDSCMWVPDGGCTTVQLLAQPWADHPDFDPAWKVQP